MKFLLIADKNQKKSAAFYTWWEVLLLSLVVILVLLMALPNQMLPTLLSSEHMSNASVGYLRALSAKYPLNLELKLAVIQHEIYIGDIKRASQRVALLKKQHHPLSKRLEYQLMWIDYLMLRYKADHTKHTSAKRIPYLQQMRDMQVKLATLPLKTGQLQAIAADSIRLGRPELALKIYTMLLKRGALNTPLELERGGDVALQNNKPTISAKFYLEAYNKAEKLRDKQKYALKTLQAYWAANKLNQALNVAKQFPDVVINTPSMLLYLAQLSMAANQIPTAEQYVLRALGLAKTLATIPNKDIDWKKLLNNIPFEQEAFETLYRLFLFQSKVQEAYQVASIAVQKNHQDLSWHKSLAKTAIWAGEFTIGMQEWLYIIKQDQNAGTMKEAISTVTALGYYIVAADMLNQYLEKYPDDPKAILELAYSQNNIGHPYQALQTLDALRKNHPSSEAYAMTAMIYQDLLQWDEALAIWKQHDQRYGPNLKSIMAQAIMYYTRGEFEQAITILKQGIPLAKPSDKEFWTSLGDLAWTTNDRAIAILSYSQDLNNSSNLISLIELLKLTNPKQALQYSLKGWSQFKDPLFLFSALYRLSGLNQPETLSNLLTNLSDKMLKIVSDRQVYWQSLARLYAAMNMPGAEMAVLLEGIAKNPTLNQLKTDLMWIIMEDGDLLSLKQLMQAFYEKNVMHEALVWQVYAEAFGVLNQTDKALALYHQHLISGAENDQIILDYANMLEKAHRHQGAYDVRLSLWQQLMERVQGEEDLDQATMWVLSQLAPYFFSGTTEMLYLTALLDRFPDDQANNILVNAFINHNFYDLVSVLTNYHMRHPIPDRIAIYLALVKNDLPTLQTIIEDSSNTWPRATHINAAVSLENTAVAEQLSFEELTDRPDADEIYEGFTQIAIPDANYVRVIPEDEQFVNVLGPKLTIEAKYKLTNELNLQPYISAWNLRTNTPDIMVNVPSEDFRVGLMLEQKIHRGHIRYRAGYRKVLGEFPTADIETNYQLTSLDQLTLGLGLNQPVYQTSYMLVGGMQDKINAALRHTITRYDFLQVDLQGQNYYSQDRHYLASGYYLQGLIEHKFWLSYPDFTVALFANIWDFNRNGEYGGDVTTLFPPLTAAQQADPTVAANILEANYLQLVPPTYKEAGFIFNFGNAILDYTHAWRPYFWATYFYNTFVGWAYTIRGGINGSVFGQDSLAIYAERGISPAVADSLNQKVGLRYSLYY